MCSQEKHPNFSSDPDWPNEQVNRSLKKCRMIAFHPVSEKQKHPPPEEKSPAPNPLHKQQKNNPRKNHGDADGVQHLVRSRSVLVVVLCHVVRQARHIAHLPAAPCGGLPVAGVGTSTFNVDSIPYLVNFLERSGTTKSSKSSCLLPRQTLAAGKSKHVSPLCHYRSRRPSIAFSIVTSSAYSRSAPTGMPTPMRVTRTPNGLRSFER